MEQPAQPLGAWIGSLRLVVVDLQEKDATVPHRRRDDLEGRERVVRVVEHAPADDEVETRAVTGEEGQIEEGHLEGLVG
eukprot:CAMPEP_0179334892 /NCGR_PEP_ID=MMETSP0797-20121207/66188_1 /TAXON_ID=47934 /ORGANISM="Dinophysis acuminata, Strain DAEP01" /LENGTH=78 /DNA_ID=CAMNT_0021048215 /DNA_START=1 /DNA_END=233 /DNA_ORIENTATION=-